MDVQDAILKVLKDPGTAPLACFDADGTLWSMDIGEAFFRWLIAGDLLPNFRGEKEIYDRYEKEVEKVVQMATFGPFPRWQNSS